MSTLKGKKVLITGGASGIGRLMGQELIQEGIELLVIWDLNAQLLQETKTHFQKWKVQVEIYPIDITDTEKVITTFQEMTAKLGTIDVIINNAGIIVGKEFIHHTHDEIDRTLHINSSSPMHIAKAALPGMLAQKSGHIVNIASAAGLISNPNMSVYCASKWAIIGWSDSLRIELERNQSGVNVTTVMPYYINTGMFAGVRSPFIPILKPEYVARKIVLSIKTDKIFLRLPWIIQLLPLIKGILPTRVFDFIVGRALGIYNTMRTFKGRSP